MKNQRVTITSLSHDGRGVAHIDGKTIFVTGALVGEEVIARIQKSKNRWDEAIVEEIIQPSLERNIPRCPSFGVCGGCSLQHMKKEMQLNYKQAALIEHLHHIGKVEPKDVLSPITSSSYEYRRKARLGVRYVIKKEKLLIGFREKNGRYLADIEICPVLHPSIGRQIPLLRQFLLQLDGYLQIPQLEIAVGDHETAIIIRHLASLSLRDQEIIKTFGVDYGFHIYLQPGGVDSAFLFHPINSLPRLSYTLEEYGITMQFHPLDFTQVNSEINKKLINQAIELLAPHKKETILDLFCGIGNFTLPVAKFSKKTIGVEGCQLMVERGYENARFNHIENIEFHCQNLTESSYTSTWMQNPFDAILLDPPRAGAWEVVQQIPSSTARRVVYISCNPATLARDAGYLALNGFELSKVGILDMFPHTNHVESIALFTRIRE